MGIVFSNIGEPQNPDRAAPRHGDRPDEPKSVSGEGGVLFLFRALTDLCGKFGALWAGSSENPEQLDLVPLRQELEKVVDFLSSSHTNILELLLSTDYPPEKYLAYHSSLGAILAILIGLELNYSRPNLVDLGLSSILHDIEMTVMPEIVLKKAKLSPAEMKKIRSVPDETRRKLQHVKGLTDDMQLAACQAFERTDGKGYPNGLKGEAINEWALIIGLASTFESMIHTRPYREKNLAPSEVAFKAAGEFSGMFPKHILRAFLATVSLYPPGTWVKLSTGEYAQTIKNNPHSSNRPTVKICLASGGRKFDVPKVMDLSLHPLVFIQGVPDKNEMAMITEKIRHPGG